MNKSKTNFKRKTTIDQIKPQRKVTIKISASFSHELLQKKMCKFQSHSFDLIHNTDILLESQPRKKSVSKPQEKLNPPLTTTTNSMKRSQKRQPSKVISEIKEEKEESAKEIVQPPRRQSQYEVISSKQKRLNNLIPTTFIQNILRQSHTFRNKKFNKLRMHCKFMAKASKVKRIKRYRSKTLPIKGTALIRHKRSKSESAKPELTILLPLQKQLKRKIAQLIATKTKNRVFKRYTTMEEHKNSILVTKENLLRYQQQLKEVSVSSESTPRIASIKFKKQYSSSKFVNMNLFNLNQKQNNKKQKNLPYSFKITQRSMHSVVDSYVHSRQTQYIKTYVDSHKQESFFEFMQKHSVPCLIPRTQTQASMRIKTSPLRQQKLNIYDKLSPYFQKY